MSYDLTVVCERRPDLSKLVEMLKRDGRVSKVEGDPALRLTAFLSGDTRGDVAFFIESGRPLENGHADEVFDGYVRFANWQVDISIPASALNYALDVATSAGKFVAQTSIGALLDPQQTGIVWPLQPAVRRRRREATPTTIDLVKLTWVLPLPPDPAARLSKAEEIYGRFLGDLKEMFPAAFPVKFGDGVNWRRDFDNWCSEWRRGAESPLGETMLFEGAEIGFGGEIEFSDPRPLPRRLVLKSFDHAMNCIFVTVNVDAAVVSSLEAADRVAAAFCSMADRLGAIYAVAHLVRNFKVSRRQLWCAEDTESRPQLGRSKWIGLPPSVGWLNWWHAIYADQLNQLHSDERTMNGAMRRLASLPCPSVNDGGASLNIPSSLVFEPGEETNTGHNFGAQPADVIPQLEAFEKNQQ